MKSRKARTSSRLDEDTTETRMLDGVRVAIDLLRESVRKRKMVNACFGRRNQRGGKPDSYEQVEKGA